MSKERKYEIIFPIGLGIWVDPDKYYNLPFDKEPRLVSELIIRLENEVKEQLKPFHEYYDNDIWTEVLKRNELKEYFEDGYFHDIGWSDLNINEVFTSIRKQYNNQKSR